MRKILIILVITFMWGAFSCKNDDWHFDDFDYTTTYFPYQYPIRTLILGDYMWDNTNDNNHKFIISARVAGMYQNNSNWEVRYQLAPELVSNLAAAENLFDGKTVKSRDTLTILPSQYYTLSPVNQVIVPKGSFVGDIEVQLTEDFFNDPFAVKTKYVLPLSIISSTTDSVLEGRTVIDNPDPRVEADWIITPKNFTIFAIKFINNYHGKYLRRGASVVTDTISSSVIDNIVYRQKYVERDEVCLLQTTGKNRVTVNGLVLRRKTDSSPGKYSMDISFNNDNNCIISTATGSDFEVSGTGKFIKDGDSWGGVNQNAIYLSYVVTEATNKHVINDTLVFRDKAVIFQEFSPEILD